MNTIIIEPKDKAEFDFFQTLIKKMKVKSKVLKEVNNLEVLIDQTENDIKNGKLKAIKTKDLWKLVFRLDS